MRAIYSIEGNIGSGKSTFLSLIQNRIPNIHVMPEPVAEWQNIEVHNGDGTTKKLNLLEKYYQDPQRWAFTFQTNAILSRMKELRILMDIMDK